MIVFGVALLSLLALGLAALRFGYDHQRDLHSSDAACSRLWFTSPEAQVNRFK